MPIEDTPYLIKCILKWINASKTESFCLTPMVLSRNMNSCVDCIIQAEDTIVVATYDYSENKSGKIIFLDENKELLKEYFTKGTLCLSYSQKKLYTAESDRVAVYNRNELLKVIHTDSLNTYIFCGKMIYSTDTSGCLMICNYDLELIKRVKISDDPLWVVKEFANLLLLGCENGTVYTYNRLDGEINQIGSKRLGILDFLIVDQKLLISSYDDKIEVYDSNTLLLLRTMKNTGSAWKMAYDKGFIYCACIYDGLRIFDSDLNILKTIKTNSICYGLCITEQELLWSSFYDHMLFWSKREDILVSCPETVEHIRDNFEMQKLL